MSDLVPCISILPALERREEQTPQSHPLGCPHALPLRVAVLPRYSAADSENKVCLPVSVWTENALRSAAATPRAGAYLAGVHELAAGVLLLVAAVVALVRVVAAAAPALARLVRASRLLRELESCQRISPATSIWRAVLQTRPRIDRSPSSPPRWL